MKRLLAAALLCLWVALAGAADGLVALPDLQARVTDLTATLSQEQRQTLEARLAEVEGRQGAQIAVLLLPSTQPEPIEQFGIRLAEAWKVGRKGVDDGVIVIVAKNDHRLRIEVGYGLEGALNDATARRIVGETISPRFKQGDYFGGLQAGLEAIISVVGGEPLPPPQARAGGGTDSSPQFGDSWLMWVVGVVFAAALARRLLGILGSFGAAGVAGFFAFSAFGGLLVAVIVGLAVFLLSFAPLSLLLHGAGFYGGGRGSSGSGGYSGGGGGFGGGGASGSW